MAFRQRHQGALFLGGDHPAGGIGRAVDNHHARVGVDRRAQAIEIEPKARALAHERDRTRLAAGQDHAVRENCIGRRDNHRVVATADEGTNGGVDRH